MKLHERLQTALAKAGWEIREIESAPSEWWCDEHWIVASVREGWGTLVHVYFLIDPQWDGPRRKGQGVWEVAATADRASDWVEASRGGVVIPLALGRFDEQIAEFLAGLSQYRRSGAATQHH